jgi:lipoprotein-anchoring transpeptidase ErfK/SrfK
MKTITRRDFLKLSAVAFGGVVVNPFPESSDDNNYPVGIIGRVTRDSASVFNEPNWQDAETVGYLSRDELVNLYYEITPPEGPPYNPTWYRIWNGYVHSAYIQKVKVRFNDPVSYLPEHGRLCEVTVPFTPIFQFKSLTGWEQKLMIYYESTHWAVGVDEGPDGKPWYRLYDELREDEYHVPAPHMRLIPDDEIRPISPDIPPEKKRIEVVIKEQTLTAFEGDTVVFFTKVSTGQNKRPDPNGLPWNTPRGTFHISSKMPSKHMGVGNLAADGYDLPGVPWTQFFHETGVAFHGTYWHDNFGLQMSHGCVNMRTSEAKWLFRWTTPIFEPIIRDHSDWEKRGYGTLVEVI